MRVKHAMLPLYARGDRHNLAELRRSMLRQARPGQGTRPAKLYISRSEASNRKLSNERELQAALERLGFTTLLLEHLDVAEQINAFAAATIIVAPHGAGLTNLLFCNEGTSILELRPDYHDNDGYARLSETLALDYHLVRGRSTNGDGWSWAVEVEKILEFVKELGC